MRFDTVVELVVDGAQAQIALKGAHEVHLVAPEHGGIFAGEVAAQEVLAFVAAGGFEFGLVEMEAEGVRGDWLVVDEECEDDEAVGVAPGFLFGGTDGKEEFVAPEAVVEGLENVLIRS